MPDEIPTTERLALALVQAGAHPRMVALAREGYYDDFKSPLAAPCMQLVRDATAAGLADIADRAKRGEFDGTKAESDAWLMSDEGRAVLHELLNPGRE